MRFEELNIIAPILRALKEENYSEPTSIQEQAIPLLLQKNDIMASAQTGTGKTAAFAIPILQHLEKDNSNSKKIKSLILTPTRELAIQIGESFTTYGKYTSIRNTVIFGGVNQNKQTAAIRNGVDVLIATPGRLLDLMNQGFISLKDIQYFVLDEADRMLDMGFIHDIKKVIAVLPSKRQSLFFSATMPDTIVELSRKILINPKKIAVTPVSSTAETIQQYLYYTNKSTKKDLLLHILKDSKMDQVLLFDRTKHGADRIVKELKKKNISAAAIHGDKAQNQRQKALTQFKDKEIRVLVATDIAARGIDIDKLQYVINFDIPNVAETYVHRIGRSGRAGEAGVSISLCEPEENDYLKDIEKLINQKIPVVKDNPFPQTDKPMTTAEKKEFEKEKQRRKQEFFANRKKNGNRGGRR
ncbi:DEAD/DEAH box family ATP-dependent RNA helicase [Marivirga tractuosa]|uniref:DEAD-box ATP-dependent RNA helicase RhpA n=1 Tax=Marivirga tractuosa (strain ATCC 23168 / DSM 4126 / NBRC 15989 / NCIMB 1408 / VKM B-1430 / H-43) TaxID=643867 RepID=E4TKU4_MARTH|nr:DEAD/DEAH box helicase [Marivirga tractuosa]ADR22247.1 DEAD/DEAH box helicase domain protein [Marivirga tractuosa DSM 4126]BDD13286.1 DEAD/DEAH box family ATP-dependent RNA helicase [Marivirga tractuosa]